MILSFKKKIFVSAIAVVSLLAIGGSVWSMVVPRQSSVTDSIAAESSKIAKQVNDGSKAGNSSTVENDVASANSDTKQNAVTPTQPKASSATSSNAGPEPTHSTISPTSNTPPQVEAPTCNQAMKVSYTSLRDSQIVAENTRWANQVNGFGNQASANGMSFSGYVEAMKQQYQPVHEANLASIEVAYQQNLVRINCS